LQKGSIKAFFYFVFDLLAAEKRPQKKSSREKNVIVFLVLAIGQKIGQFCFRHGCFAKSFCSVFELPSLRNTKTAIKQNKIEEKLISKKRGIFAFSFNGIFAVSAFGKRGDRGKRQAKLTKTKTEHQ
jgi:hypothetical protein